MVMSRGSNTRDADFLTSILVTSLPQLVEDSDVVEFLVRDVLIREHRAWESPEGLQNVLKDSLLDLGLCSSDLDAQLLCEDLHQACQQPNMFAVRLCTALKQGNSLPEAFLSCQQPEDEEHVPPGTCVLCERHMPLTWHHLFPREVQKKYLKRGLMTEEDRHRGISICRQCHNTIHQSFDNKLLADKLHSVELLLQQEMGIICKETEGKGSNWP